MFANLTPALLVITLLSLIISLVIHEVMHGYMAKILGDDTALEMGRLSLNPLHHIDLFTTILLPMVLIISGLPPILAAKPVPFNPDRVKFEEFGAALVGIAGPLTNLVLAGLAAVIFHATAPINGSLLYNSLVIFTEINVLFFVFNMIPFPPLDGSRLLYAFAPEPLQEIMRQIEAFGFVAILLFIFFIFQFVSGPIVNIQQAIVTFLLV